MTILEHHSRKNLCGGQTLGLVLVGVALLVSGACSAEVNEPAQVGMEDVALADAEIVGVATALNEGEIQVSRLGLANTASPELRAFSEEMITDHTAMLEKVSALGITPAPSPLRSKLEEDVAAIRAKLANLEPPAFDQAYVDAQVELHERALRVLTTELIPDAKNPALKDELTQAVGKVRKHLAHAVHLQATLRSATP